MAPEFLNTTCKGTNDMNAFKIKDALITTAVVLGVIFALNQVGITKSVVQKALQG